jgi:hypothetical protein
MHQRGRPRPVVIGSCFVHHPVGKAETGRGGRCESRVYGKALWSIVAEVSNDNPAKINNIFVQF